jgi:hypothetical protein
MGPGWAKKFEIFDGTGVGKNSFHWSVVGKKGCIFLWSGVGKKI